jgi:phosphoadenosine phosphosulfate reductase
MPLTPSLQQKIDQSRLVIEEAFDTFPPESMVLAWSGGKDSTLLLVQILEIARARSLSPPRVLDIDQGDAFGEIIDFRNRLVRDWFLDLVIVRNDDFLDKAANIGDAVSAKRLNASNREALAEISYSADSIPWLPSAPVCSHLMKAVPVRNWLREQRVRVMFTGIRWDEHPARQSETYFSERQNPPHTRVHPLLHLSERDVWDITIALNVPYNALYAQGYRSIDTRSGTRRLSGIPAWQQNLEQSAERHGRDEEKERMMQQLRDWGYM